MKFIRKYIIWILCTIVLMGVLFFASFAINLQPTLFYVNSEFGDRKITIYEAKDGNCYVFFPPM